MLNLPLIRTKRISVQPKELTIRQAIALCRMPPERAAAAETAFLRFAFADLSAGAGQVSDPLLLTVEERAYLVCRYLSATLPEPDFLVGASAHLSDYLMFDRDYTLSDVPITALGKSYTVTPLLGVHAELLERCCANAGEWMIGIAALQIVPAGETRSPGDLAKLPEAEALAWATGRIDALNDMPESEFEELFDAYSAAREQMAHFLNLAVDDQGICFEPQKGAADGSPLARFSVDAAISPSARILAG